MLNGAGWEGGAGSEHIINKIKSAGHRLTKARQSIIALFINIKHPLSAGDIITALADIKLRVNITTVYRELDFLENQGIIKELKLCDSSKKYELWSDTHHHHIVCVKCSKIQCIKLNECMKSQEQIAANQSNYLIINHTLNFYGLCPGCL
ncbi:Ferric-uptake regulator [Candidatus Magnetoovum chiemensis]|nr:Ferric-uptake regulator [Candidatus Magnetoovum chiemensis]